MIAKQILFFGQTEAGIFAQAIFDAALTKTAAPVLASWDTAPAIQTYIKTITPEDRKRYCYVLVNALGAGEYFGSNINADYFPWDALAHEGDDYGYKTFLNAHAFQHHANKDPTRAFGVPVVSVLNPRMKRVELIIRLDRELAKKWGADGIITRIENGEFPDVSMGCKVPFDVCSKCGHHSKTRDDYCLHMRPPEELRGIYGPNKILPDGTKIYVVNTRPRFFDISFVFIGADKTAKVMAKLASRGAQHCLGSVCALPASTGAQDHHLFGPTGEEIAPLRKTASAAREGLRGPCGRLCEECDDCDACHTSKLASAFGVKEAAHRKLSEIVKSVPSGLFATKKLPALEQGERDIAPRDLDQMAEHPLPSILASATRVGMVLKPHEFQHLVLRRMGEDGLLDRLNGRNEVFRQVGRDCPSGLSNLDDALDQVFQLLKSYIRERTVLGSPFQLRVMVASDGSKNSLPTKTPIGDSLLDKVSAAYNGYRREVLEKMSQAVSAVRSDPRLAEAVLGDGLSMMFKTASSSILSADSLRYVLGAHLQDRTLLTASSSSAATFNDANLAREIHIQA